MFLRLPLAAALSCLVGCGTTAPEPVAAENVLISADRRDQQVLEAVLLRILADPDIHLTRASAADGTLVLYDQYLTRSGVLRPEAMRNYLGEGHAIPSELAASIWFRNERAGSNNPSFAAFAHLEFDSRIVLGTEAESGLGLGSFTDTFPLARAWLRAWLPGYSSDAKYAVVRASVGPAPHGALVTAYLRESNGEWRVEWHHMAWFF